MGCCLEPNSARSQGFKVGPGGLLGQGSCSAPPAVALQADCVRPGSSIALGTQQTAECVVTEHLQVYESSRPLCPCSSFPTPRPLTWLMTGCKEGALFFSGEGVSEVEKESLIALPGKERHVRLLPRKPVSPRRRSLSVPAADMIWSEFPQTGVWELNLS